MEPFSADTFEIDLRSAIALATRRDPDYLVPIPRKGLKLLRGSNAVREVGRPLILTSALMWSPSIAGARPSLSLLDDATVRGKTLMREVGRLRNRQLTAQPFAIYRCADSDMVSRASKGKPTSFPREIEYVRSLDGAQYEAYGNLLRHRTAAANPLLEHDHVVFRFSSVGRKPLTTKDLIKIACALGDPVSYPYSQTDATAGVSVFLPVGLGDAEALVGDLGITGMHAKIRLFLDREAECVFAVPMALPDLPITPDLDSRPNEVWSALSEIGSEAGLKTLPTWESTGLSLAESASLVYSLSVRALSATLLRGSIAAANGELSRYRVEHVGARGDLGLTIEATFGPELSPLAEGVAANDGVGRLVFTRLAQLLMSGEGPGFLQIPLELGLADPEPRPQTAQFYNGQAVTAFSTDLVAGLRQDYLEKDVEQDGDDRAGSTFAMLLERWPSTPPITISQAIDYLCDTGYIVPYADWLGGDAGVFGRLYRTAEITWKPQSEIEQAIAFLAWLVDLSMREVPAFAAGVPPTFLNKLVANIYQDMEQLIDSTERYKLRALQIEGYRFGPEVHVYDELATLSKRTSIYVFESLGFNLDPHPETDAANPEDRRVVITPPENRATLGGFEPSAGVLIEQLAMVYVNAFKRLKPRGRDPQVSASLLPLAVARKREWAFDFIRADLAVWLEDIQRASNNWDDPAKCRIHLDNADTVLRAFGDKLKLRTRLNKLWPDFLKEAGKVSSVLAERLGESLDGEAVVIHPHRQLRAIGTFFERVQAAAERVRRADPDGLGYMPSERLKRAAKDVAVAQEDIDSLLEIGDLNGLRWHERVPAICRDVLKGVPDPKEARRPLHSKRMEDVRTASAARNIVKASGGAVFVVMGDLRESQFHAETLESVGSWEELVELEFRKNAHHWSSNLHGENLVCETGDHFAVTFRELDSALRFSGTMIRACDDIEGDVCEGLPEELADRRFQVAVRVGIVEVDDVDRERAMNRVTLCRQMSRGHPPFQRKESSIFLHVGHDSLPQWAVDLPNDERYGDASALLITKESASHIPSPSDQRPHE